MDEEEIETEGPQPKISLGVGIIGTIIAILFDILSFIPIAGDIEEVPIGVILLLNFIGGVGNTVLLVQGIVMVAKVIPGVQELPLWTPAWLFMWYLENHPSSLTTAVETIGNIENFGESAEVAMAEETQLASAQNTLNKASQAESSALQGESEAEALSNNAKPSERKNNQRQSGDSNYDDSTTNQGSDNGEESETEQEKYRRQSDEEYAKEMEPMPTIEEQNDELFRQKQAVDNEDISEDAAEKSTEKVSDINEGRARAIEKAKNSRKELIANKAPQTITDNEESVDKEAA
jgi:hypothetical protein